jgi:hypothetical protein
MQEPLLKEVYVPFRSESQRRFLWAKHPEIARRWTEEHGSKPVPKKQHQRGGAKKKSNYSNAAKRMLSQRKR